MPFQQPPELYNEEGKIRTVGFELEFADVDIEESVGIIQELYGGRVEKEHRFKQSVKETSLGDFTVMIDLRLLHEKGYQKVLEKFNINLQDIQWGENNLEYEVESTMENIIRTVIPYEITSPPVPVNKLEELDKLRKSLQEHHATGTKSFPTNAFAIHINPEIPAKDVDTILRYMRAFFLLYPWIFKESKIDMARRVSSFISPFPSKYSEMVVKPSYKPGIDTLIEDYHLYNPDRNRPLDMYPLFAEVRKEKVNSYSDIGKVNARPTFHYRLPNSLINQEDWSLADEWKGWVLIERLASDSKRLEEMSRAYMELSSNTLIGFESKWTKETEKWLS
ncbi:amidoligase family protein [Nafulsella turpanensis]|uniref:amidoligase family protein n=1 Tax=Nafulsella turpanensis TaxID=1265690 RepID=UPI00034B040E|nr:amidoligase family protein [Nafulsella turpanensis]